MALSNEEKQILEYAKAQGKTAIEAKTAIAKFRAEQTTQTEQTTQEPGMQDRLAEVGNNTASTISANLTGSGEYADQSPLRRGVQATAAAFSAVPKGALAMAPEPVRKGVDYVADKVGAGFNALTQKIGSTELFKGAAGQVQTDPNSGVSTYQPNDLGVLEEGLGIAAAGGEIAGNILGAKGVSNTLATSAKLAQQGTKIASAATSKLVSSATGLVKSSVVPAVKSAIKSPEKSIAGATGEVLQGKPADIAKGLEALKSIDTTGVKTYAELGTKIDNSIKTLSERVDSELLQDLTKTKLSDLRTELKTKSGVTVTTNYVDTALTQMKELYQKTGDVQKAADIEELITTANGDGLTKFDINNISRVYNSEFGSKAFSKLGDPLTSVNAQLYETVRKGLKGKAREGIGGAEAQAADATISALYNTKTLVTRNIDAVNKLQQRISERGAFEKAGYFVSKYADILTGGSIRGFIGGILPRGAGYKTMNALDLEKRLEANLEIINRASKATTDAEMAKILSEIAVD